MPANRICNIENCNEEIDPQRQMMCKPHWYMVPQELRTETVTAWRSFNSPQATKDMTEYKRREAKWNELRGRAIAHVQEQLLRGVLPPAVGQV